MMIKVVVIQYPRHLPHTRNKRRVVPNTSICIMFTYCYFLCFMHNNAFWSNSNVFSLVICKVYTKRENAGSWNSGPEKATSESPIMHISKWAENLQRIVLEYKKIMEQITTGGGHLVTTRHQGAQGPQACLGGLWPTQATSGAHLLVYKSFWPRKNKRRTFGT